MTIIETRLRNYWTALRVLRGAKSQEQRMDITKGTVTMTMLTETNPVLKQRLQATIQEELQRTA